MNMVQTCLLMDQMLAVHSDDYDSGLAQLNRSRYVLLFVWGFQ